MNDHNYAFGYESWQTDAPWINNKQFSSQEGVIVSDFYLSLLVFLNFFVLWAGMSLILWQSYHKILANNFRSVRHHTENTEALLGDRKDVGPGVNPELICSLFNAACSVSKTIYSQMKGW
jgi:hypothetical protein